MASSDRTGADHLTRLEPLLESPDTQHIFYALRLLEAVHEDAPRLGESRRPKEDRLRLGQEAELAFPTSTIRGFAPGGGTQPRD